MSHVWLVTRREIVTRGRSKSYLIGLIVSVVFVGVVAALPQLFGDPSYTVGVADDGQEQLRTVLVERAEAVGLDVTVTVVPDESAARAGVVDGELDAALPGGQVVLADGPVDSQLSQLLDTANQMAVTKRQLRGAGLAPDTVKRALTVPPLEYRSVRTHREESPVAIGLAVVVVATMMMLIYMPAIYVATGVVEEKSSRVVELLLATIRPWQLLAGKITGIGVLGLLQLAAIAGTGVTVATVTGLTVELPPGMGGLLVSLFGWFLLGYAFFGSLAAGFGALVSRQEDVNGVLTPVTVLMMVAYVVGFLAVFNPSTTLAYVLSMVPPFAVVVMPTRMAGDVVPAGEVALAVALMVLAVGVVLVLAARVYHRAVLRTGARVRLAEALGMRGRQR